MVRFSRTVSLPALSTTTLLLTGLFSQAYASGFQLGDLYSTTEIGLAGAGGAAYAQDATTDFSNPAGLVNLKNPEFVVAGTLISSDADFSGQACGGAVNAAKGLHACTPVPTSENGGTNSFVPAFHYAMPLSDRVYAGVRVTAPFGLSTYYDDPNLVYQATDSNIQTININPNIAFKFNDQFSLGAGIDIEEMNATLNSHSNLMPNSTLVGSKFGLPVTQIYSDSAVRNYADDWGVGWNAGALYQFSPGSRIGLSYRSAIQHDLSGTSEYEGGTGTRYLNGTPIATGNYPTYKTDVSADVKLPATTTLSFYQELTSQWAVMSSLYYTQWNSIQNLTLKDVAFIDTNSTLLIQPSQSRDVTYPENFKNTWRYALGTEYKVNDALTLRAGGNFDQSPVNNTDRTIRLPDSNRWTAALGAGYRISPNVKIDAAYMHIWFEDNAKIDQPGAGTPQYTSYSVGSSDVSANLYSLQATFDIV